LAFHLDIAAKRDHRNTPLGIKESKCGEFLTETDTEYLDVNTEKTCGGVVAQFMKKDKSRKNGYRD
jgi:hypothetical protein